eukprot:gene1522-4836_t
MSDSASESARHRKHKENREENPQPAKPSSLSSSVRDTKELKWERGEVGHWNESKHCGGIRPDDDKSLSLFTPRSAFIVKDKMFPVPDVSDKVFFIRGPDPLNPGRTIAIRAVREIDLGSMEKLHQSILSGELDLYLAGLDDMEQRKPPVFNKPLRPEAQKRDLERALLESRTELQQEKEQSKRIRKENRNYRTKIERDLNELENQYNQLADEKDDVEQKLADEQRRSAKKDKLNAELEHKLRSSQVEAALLKKQVSKQDDRIDSLLGSLEGGASRRSKKRTKTSKKRKLLKKLKRELR